LRRNEALGLQRGSRMPMSHDRIFCANILTKESKAEKNKNTSDIKLYYGGIGKLLHAPSQNDHAVWRTLLKRLVEIKVEWKL
jgi:hypothetical protein